MDVGEKKGRPGPDSAAVACSPPWPALPPSFSAGLRASPGPRPPCSQVCPPAIGCPLAALTPSLPAPAMGTSVGPATSNVSHPLRPTSFLLPVFSLPVSTGTKRDTVLSTQRLLPPRAAPSSRPCPRPGQEHRISEVSEGSAQQGWSVPLSSGLGTTKGWGRRSGRSCPGAGCLHQQRGPS